MSWAKLWFWMFAFTTVSNAVRLAVGDTDFELFGLFAIPRAVALVLTMDVMLLWFEGAPLWLRRATANWATRKLHYR